MAQMTMIVICQAGFGIDMPWNIEKTNDAERE